MVIEAVAAAAIEAGETGTEAGYRVFMRPHPVPRLFLDDFPPVCQRDETGGDRLAWVVSIIMA